jgi:hypothetical protein
LIAKAITERWALRGEAAHLKAHLLRDQLKQRGEELAVEPKEQALCVAVTKAPSDQRCEANLA